MLIPVLSGVPNNRRGTEDCYVAMTRRIVEYVHRRCVAFDLPQEVIGPGGFPFGGQGFSCPVCVMRFSPVRRAAFR